MPISSSGVRRKMFMNRLPLPIWDAKQILSTSTRSLIYKPEYNTSHKVKARFYYRGDNIADGSNSGKSITDILGNMGTDVNAITGIVQNVQNGDYSMLYPIIQPALQGDLNGLVNGTTNLLGSIFPTATQPITATCFHG